MKQFLTMLLIATAAFILLSIAEAFSERRRWRQFTRFAELGGYSLTREDTSKSAPFFQDLSSRHFLRRFEISQVRNILRGQFEGIAFVYFEQSLTAATGSIAFGGRFSSNKLGSDSQSVVALEIPESTHFEFDPESHKNVKVHRIENWVYFLPIKPHIIPLKKLEKFLAEISSIFKVGLEKASDVTNTQ